MLDKNINKFKFKIGDKVRSNNGKIYIVIGQFIENEKHVYNLKGKRERILYNEEFLTPIDSGLKNKFKFKIGDKAILNRNIAFCTKDFGICIINVGTEVEIINSFNLCGSNLCEIKFQNAISTVYDFDLDYI